ncbi:MAG TPA: 3'-5' exonuclease [Candidatus Absconditabacterales bacterium]|nr:3'-5' exonuclease [Candidatus Absconditabacterales bacterium]
MKNKYYIVLDIETTGLSKYKHQITEIAAIKFDGENVLDKFHTLVNPQKNIPSMITKLTGITNEMVKDSPTISEVVPDFLNFIQDNIIVAHNASFDLGFLSECIYSCQGFWLENDVICTRKLANRLLPDLDRKNLGSICDYMGLVNDSAHRAMGDTEVTVKVFKNFLKLLKNNGIDDKLEIIKFQDKSIRDCVF